MYNSWFCALIDRETLYVCGLLNLYVGCSGLLILYMKLSRVTHS
jgi:hypothetical protein